MKTLPYIVITILLFLLGLMYFQYWKKSEESDRKDTIIQEKESQAKHWETESGRQAMEKQAAIASAKEFQEAYPKAVEELKAEFGVKFRDLKAYVRAEFEVRGQGEGVINNTYLIDSAGRKYKEFKMDDGYLRFSTMLFDSITSAPYEYAYSDTLTYGFTMKRKWFLGKETLYGFGGLRNPQAKITSATNVLIKDFRDKRWVISVGVSYNPILNNFSPSVNFGYALIKF